MTVLTPLTEKDYEGLKRVLRSLQVSGCPVSREHTSGHRPPPPRGWTKHTFARAGDAEVTEGVTCTAFTSVLLLKLLKKTVSHRHR